MKVNRRSEAGLATLETALVLPLLLLVVFAIVELGLGFARLQVVQNAAREGARAAVLFRAPCEIGRVESDVRAAVNAFSGTLGMGTLPAPTFMFPQGGNACTAPIITVNVSFRHQIPLTGGFASFFTGGPVFINLPGSSTAATQPTTRPPGT